ncbi:MAG: hypothetical protein ACYSWS_00840 [Planctomycetota bacterium]|jgi:hypothetical protein
MARIRVKLKATGQIGTVEEYEFDPTIYEVIGQTGQQPESRVTAETVPTPVPEEPGWLEKLGGFGLGMAKSMAEPFRTTGKNIGLLGQVATAKALEPFAPQAAARVAGVQDVPFLGDMQEQARKISEEPGKALGEQVAASGEIASYAIPFGKARKGAGLVERALTKAILPGAASGFLVSPETEKLFKGEEVNEEALAGSIMMGAAIPLIIQGLAKGIKSIRGVGGKMTKTAEKAAEKAVRPTKTQVNAFKKRYGVDIGEYITENRLQGMSYDDLMDKLIDPLQNSYDDIARKSGLKITKKQFDEKTQQYVFDLIDSGTGDDLKLAEKILEEYDNVLSSTGLNKGPVDVSKLSKMKTSYAGKVKNWLGNPIEGGKNRVMGNITRETVYDAAEQAGMKTVEGANLSDLGQQLARLNTYSDIVLSQAGKGRGAAPVGLITVLTTGGGTVLGGVPGGAAAYAGTRILNDPRTASFSSKALYGLGNLVTKMPTEWQVPGAISKAATQAALRIPEGEVEGVTPTTTERAVDLATQVPTGMPPTVPPITQKQSLTGYSPEQLDQGYMAAIRAGDKTAASSLMKMFKDETQYQKQTVGKAPTISQMARTDMVNSIQKIAQQFKTTKSKLGTFAGYAEGLKSAVNLGDQDVLDFYNTASQLKATLAKARAGTSFTPNEEGLLNQYTPKKGDSIQQLETKIKGLLALTDSLNRPISELMPAGYDINQQAVDQATQY